MQTASPTIADQVAVKPDLHVYRDAGVALTRRGEANSEAKAFVAFLGPADG